MYENFIYKGHGPTINIKAKCLVLVNIEEEKIL